ncbi:hypothetical protein [Vibrio casei]|uniref:hypothetical protein n=1 Tax=Vibrio casei TaxID=673372 RepID=UPI003F9E318E
MRTLATTLNYIANKETTTVNNKLDGVISFDVSFSGSTIDGAIYKRKPNQAFVKFDLINNDIDRRYLSNSSKEVMMQGIHQIGVYVPKGGSVNADIVAIGAIDEYRKQYVSLFNNSTINDWYDFFTDTTINLNLLSLKQLSEIGQMMQISHTSMSPKLQDDTHVYYVLSAYFNVIS